MALLLCIRAGAACSRLDAAVPQTLELRLIRPQNPEGVLLNEELVFFFSDDVDRASVTRASIRIRARDGAEARGKLQVDGPQVRFVPAPVLAPDLSDGGYRPATEYEVEIAGFPRTDGIRGAGGKPLSRTILWSFRTVAVGEPRARLIFDDRYQDRFKPLVVFPPPTGPADAKYLIGPQGSVYLACEKPIDPASVRDGDFQFLSAALAVAARVRLIENEPFPAVRPRPSGVVSAFPDGWTRQPRAALIEITPRQPLAPGLWRLKYDPLRPGRWQLRHHPSVPIAFAIRGLLRVLNAREFSLRDFSAEPALDPGLLPREIRVEPTIGAAGRGGLTEDFVDARLRSPIAVGGADGTAYWSDLGRVEVRYPAAAGSGADGEVRLRGAESRSDVQSLALSLAAGESCTLRPEPGLVVLRAQGRISIAGRLARATGTTASVPTLAAWQRRPAEAPPAETLSAWLERVRERDEDWTVLVAGGDLVIDGELATTTPLCLCAGGVIRVSGAVRGVPNQVFLLREGGGLNIDPPASIAPLRIDPPRDRNPLVRPLRFAVLSSPIPPNGGVRRWLSAEARGSDARPVGAGGSWRVRYVPEIQGDRADLGALSAAASPIELDRVGPLQILIELVVEPGGAWDPPWVDHVRLAWEQGSAGDVR